MANLKKLTDAIDALVVKGDIITAFEQYAADNCCTLSNESDKTTSKAQKIDALKWFFEDIASANHIERVAVKLLNDEVADSQFIFDFTTKYGQPLRFNEIIRRTWKNGKLVEELYLAGQVIDQEPAASPAKKTATKSTSKSADQATPKAAKPSAPKAEKAVAPKAEKAPAAKAPKAKAEKVAPVKADDLTLIEGIGPKIAELLIAAGIKNFAELAKAKPAAIKTVLDNAGKRYQMHDPATWPKQAALARDGKTAELQKLQAELKGGK